MPLYLPFQILTLKKVLVFSKTGLWVQGTVKQEKDSYALYLTMPMNTSGVSRQNCIGSKRTCCIVSKGNRGMLMEPFK